MKRLLPLFLFMGIYASEPPTLTVVVDADCLDRDGLCRLALECCFGDQAPFYSQLLPYIQHELQAMPNDEGVQSLQQYYVLRQHSPQQAPQTPGCPSPHSEKICAMVSRAFDQAIIAKDKEIESIKREAEEKAKQTRFAIAANLATAVITGVFTWLASTEGR